MKKLYVILLMGYVFKISSCEVIIETTSGPIRSTDSLSPDVEAFLGIPFAEPPVGDLRFAKPVPKQPWTEIYDASSLPPPCVQFVPKFKYYFNGDLSDMSEDCLYLNIWMPKAKPRDRLRPVIIYIHHGTFLQGSSSQKEFDGSNLASRGDVVLVTINYRLGLFGFFLAYVEEADGNMGMYDQLMAIEWVSANAQYFGGDPENVVLVGTSAGAISEGALMVSPLSKHLFRRVFFQSGSIMNPLYFEGNDKLFTTSEQVASLSGCLGGNTTLKSDPKSVVRCLKARPVETMLEAEETLMKSKPVQFFPRSGDEFLPEDPRLMFREGKFRRDVEAIVSTASDEGCILLFIAAGEYFGRYGDIPLTSVSRGRGTALGRTAAYLFGIKNPEHIIGLYINMVENRTGVNYVKTVTDAIGDYGINCGSVFLAEILSLGGNSVYYYKLGFRAASTPLADWVQATHLDDVQYMFGNPYHGNFTAEEVRLSDRFIARLSAFAKTGNPNLPEEVPWPQYSYQNPLYLFMGQEEESVRRTPWKNCEIWRKDFKSEIDSDLVQSLSNIIPHSARSGFEGTREISVVALLACFCLTFTYGVNLLKCLL